MDSRYLRAFVAVVEHGGISAAAQRLGYAQSSVSAQLKRLEADLGVAVLVRAGTGAVLTEAGRRLLPHAREALELEDLMRRAARGDRPRLRIAAQQSLAHGWMPDVLAALEHGGGAGADIELTVGPRADLERAFAAGEIDVFFQYDKDARGPGPHTVLGHDRAVLVAAPGHPLARESAVAPERLLHYDFLVSEPGCTAAMLTDRFGRDLLDGAHVAMVQGSVGTLIRLAGHGRGVALLPEMAVARELASGDLVPIPVTGRLRPVAILAQWRPRLGPAEAALRALLATARRADPIPSLTDDLASA
ncbi:LysR family transcriptional regulator [Actinocorallia aurea]